MTEKSWSISEVSIESINSSQYIKPMRMTFKQGSRHRTWDLMKVHDSVAAILYHKPKDSLVFVRQFRPAIWLNRLPADAITNGSVDCSLYPASLGVTYELCAGIIDKSGLSPQNTIQEEILEECGFDVPLDKIQKVTSFRSGVGVSGANQTLYFAEIDDTTRVNSGGGNTEEGEEIEVVYIPVAEALTITQDEEIMKPPAFIAALYWFYITKAPQYLTQITAQ